MKTNKLSYFIWLLALLPFIMNIAVFSFYSFRGLPTILYIILFASFLFKNKAYIAKEDRIVSYFILFPLLVYTLSSLGHFAFPKKGLIFGILYGCILLKCNRTEQLKVFDLFLNITTVLLFLSIVEFVIVQTFGRGIQLGNVVRIEEEVFNNTTYFKHYIFNLIKNDVISRFQSIMEEPGNVGTLCGFLLFAIGNNPRYKRQFIIVIFAGIISLSMAFYALLGIYMIGNLNIKHLKVFVLMSLVIVTGIFVFQEQFESKIINCFNSENLDDRSNELFDKHLDNFVQRGDIYLFLGNGSGATNSINIGRGVVGAKRELYDFGIIGCLLFFLGSVICYFKFNKVSKHSILFFIAFWLSWYQRADIYNPSYLLIFFNIYNAYRTRNSYVLENRK